MRAVVGRCRCHLWQRGVSAMAPGSRHHSLHAHARQCSKKEESWLWPGAIYLSAGEQQLPLSGRRTTSLRGVECSQSRPCLHRQCQAVWSMLAKSPMHDWTLQVSRRARELAHTPEFANEQRQRKKVE